MPERNDVTDYEPLLLNDKPPPGKFEGNDSLKLSEFLYHCIQEGSQDEQFGSVEDNIWEGLLNFDDGEIEYIKHSLGVDFKPAYIVTEDGLGFFTYYEYDSEEEARSKYMADLAAYESHYN